MVSQDPASKELRRGSGAWVECLRLGGRIQSFDGMPSNYGQVWAIVVERAYVLFSPKRPAA